GSSHDAEHLGQLEMERDQQIKRIDEAILRWSVGLFRELKDLDSKEQRDRALEAARVGSKELATAISDFEIEIANFQKEAQPLDASVRERLLEPSARGVQQLKEDMKKLNA